MVEVEFHLASGEMLTFAGQVGDTVMDVALDNGVPGIIAQCGGGCTCCTCHCWVALAWLSKLDEPHQDELDMLEYAWGADQRSRLSCQIRLSEELNGIPISIPAQQA